MGALAKWVQSEPVLRLAESRKLPWLLALLGILMMVPALWAGYYQDDHLIRLRFEGFPGLPGVTGNTLDTCVFGDMVAMGVLDPCKVTRSALQNAASIAGLILTTDCMVAELREEPTPAHTPGSEMEM